MELYIKLNIVESLSFLFQYFVWYFDFVYNFKWYLWYICIYYLTPKLAKKLVIQFINFSPSAVTF
jgi:hypothetical protein